MSVRVVFFSCRRDADLLRVALSTVPDSGEWKVRVVVETKDLDAFSGLGSGVEVVADDFPRGRTLNGSEALVGVALLLGLAATGVERVAKMDSDSLLFAPGFLTFRGLAGIAHPFATGAALGLAYSMPSDAARLLEASVREEIRLGSRVVAEDRFLTPLALALSRGEDGRLGVGSLFWERFDGRLPEVGGREVVGHYRSRRSARKVGVSDEPGITRLALEAMLRDRARLGLLRRVLPAGEI
jgi:hypothetical protein